MKIDFKKTLPLLYGDKSPEFHLVDVPEMAFLMIDGKGDPNQSPAYRAAVECLFATAYKTKFLSKKELNEDYVVPPLEGLWWADDLAAFAERLDRSQWCWTMMIMQPGWITRDMIDAAKDQAAKKVADSELQKLRFERFLEGPSLQCLHIGSYDNEAPVLARLHDEIMPRESYDFSGHHHEIYLSDPRRVAPEKLKTILRQPVKKG